MKVLRLSSYCYPEQIASSHLAQDMNEAYEKAGIICEIHAPTPTRGIDEETRKKYKKIKYEELNSGFIQIHRFPMFKEPKNSLLRAARYTLCIIMQLLNGLAAKGIDVYYASSTPPINGLMFPVLKFFKRYKIIYNLQDIFPDSLVNTGMTKNGSILWWIGHIVEKITYRFTDKIIVISEDFKKNILEKGVPEEKIEVVYNWIDVEQIKRLERSDNPIFDELGLDRNKFYITYAGNLGFSQNIRVLLEAAMLLKENKDINFVIIGNGADEDNCRKYIEENALDNVRMFPMQPIEKVEQVYNLGDASLVSCKGGTGGIGMPSKLCSIMSAGRAVLASFDKGTEIERIITENETGIFTEADDSQKLADAILRLYNDPEFCIRCGENARRYTVENLSSEKSTSRIIQILTETVKER